jgi:integrator complex subunit 6
MHRPIPGTELKREPFRWDQQMFSIVLRLPGIPVLDRDSGFMQRDRSPIDAMCEVTGGNTAIILEMQTLERLDYSLMYVVQWSTVGTPKTGDYGEEVW